jgi:PAS domain S-box-containing protein
VDSGLVVTSTNPAMSGIVFREPAQMIGQRAGGSLGCSHSFEEPGGCGFASACSTCELRKSIGEVLASGERVTQREVLLPLRIDGAARNRWLSVSVEPVEIDGARSAIVAVDDVTERKETERALAQSRARFEEVVRRIPVGVFVFEIRSDGEQRFVYVSPMFSTILGLDAGAVAQGFRGIFRAVHPADRAQLLRASLDVIACHGPFRWENRFVVRGELRWIRIEADPEETPEGGTVWNGVVTDLTQRRRDEEALRRSRALVTRTEAIARIGSYRWDLGTQRVTWSDGMFRLFGVDPGSFDGDVGRVVAARIHGDDAPAVLAANEALLRDRVPTPLSYRIVDADGTERTVWAQGELEPGDLENGEALVGFVQDITERRRAEEEQRQLTESLAATLEALPDLMFDLDRDGRFHGFNAPKSQLLFVPPELFLGRSVAEVLPKEAGDVIGAALAEAARDGRHVGGSFSLPLPGGDRCFELSIAAKGSAGNERERFVVLSRDVTERERANEAIRRLNADLELRVSERTAELKAANSELEAFSYSVSHDLRAPLRAIEGFSAMLLETLGAGADPESRRLLGVVRSNALKMARLIDDLLAFSRLGRSVMHSSRLHMSSMARLAFEEVVPDAGDRSRIVFHVGELPAVRGDAALVHQVWLNLLSNAVKYSAGAAEPVIDVEGTLEGDEAVYRVRDNGAGFEMAYAGKLFGVFQRLHPASEFQGTGVGLALAARIVSRHGGRIWAEGAVGQGASFSFSLPVAPKGAD